MMKYKLLTGSVLTFAVLVPEGFAQSQGPRKGIRRPAEVNLYQVPARKMLGLNLELSGGRGSFQDLQAPYDASGEFRVDGTQTVEESSNHSGVMLSAKLGYEFDYRLGRFFSDISVTRVTSLAPVGLAAASYARYNLQSGTTWTVGNGFSLLSALEIRRSMFRNTDNGHYLDAALVRAGFEQDLDQFTLTGFAGMSAFSRFGFMQDSGRGKSGLLANTVSSLQEYAVKLTWSPSKSADLFLSMAQENITAAMSDIQAYESFGLNVSKREAQREKRQINLSTSLISVGANRRF